MPQAAFGGEYLHSSLAEMAAAYLFHLCQNHPFADGKKRTAAFTTVLFLALNGVADDDLPPQEALEEVTWKVARGETDKPGITAWLRTFVAD